jgi:hypothetical protein
MLACKGLEQVSPSAAQAPNRVPGGMAGAGPPGPGPRATMGGLPGETGTAIHNMAHFTDHPGAAVGSQTPQDRKRPDNQSMLRRIAPG